MAHSSPYVSQPEPEEALRQIDRERKQRSWLALILFLLAGGALFTTFYFSYRTAPAPNVPDVTPMQP